MPDRLFEAVRTLSEPNGVRVNGAEEASATTASATALERYSGIKVWHSNGYGPLRPLLLNGFRLIERQPTYAEARRISEQLATLLVFASGEGAADMLRSVRDVANEAAYRDLISALAYIDLGEAMPAIVELLSDLSRDHDDSLREAAEDALAAVEFIGTA